MDVRDRIRSLLDEVPPLPAGDPDATFLAGRRRVRRRRAAAASGTAAVAAIAVVLVMAMPGGDTSPPMIADAPGTGDDVQVPAGWETVTAGDIAVSVPPDWEISRPYEGLEVPDDAVGFGPCLSDLQRPRGIDEPHPGVPVAVVYDRPTAGQCRGGFGGPPPEPGLVLFETRLGTVDGVEDQPGAERVDIEEHAERDRIGALEVWRTVDSEPIRDLDPSGVVTYIPVDLLGGLIVAHPDDAIVQRILATVRPAAPPDPSADGSSDLDTEAPSDPDDGAPSDLAPEPSASDGVVDLPGDSQPGEASLGAMTGGVLTTDDEDCVWLIDPPVKDEPFEPEVALIWPGDYSFDTSTQEILDPDGQVVASIGDQVSLGGGETPHRAPEWPERCDAVDRVWSVAPMESRD